MLLKRLAIVLLLTLTPFQAYGEFAASQKLSVMVRDSKLRASPSHWSPARADLKYGDSITVVTPGDAWVEVSDASGVKGFIHVSSVSARQVILKAGAEVNNQGVEPANVVLAGKGFNQDVEDLYLKQEKNLNYSRIDSWEKEKISEELLASFMKDGGLNQ